MWMVKFDNFDFYPKLSQLWVKILASDLEDFLQDLTSKTCTIVC